MKANIIEVDNTTRLVELPRDIQRDFRAIFIVDFLTQEIPLRECILAPWLPSQGLAMIHAPRGVGKTHLALGIAYAVASGGKFLRWQAPKARGVLLLDGEMPARALQERLAAIVEATDKEPESPFLIITPDLQGLGMPDLTSPEDQVLLDVFLEGVDLIIVDNISTLCRTGRENEAEGWLPVQEWALRMRSSGRAVLFIHHSGKGGGQRGTSKREDVLDAVIGLRRPAGYTEDQGAAFEVHFEKARGFHGEDAKPFEACLETDEHGRQCWAIRSLDECTYSRVVSLLNDGLPQKEIATELGLAKSTVSHHVKRARTERTVSDGG